MSVFDDTQVSEAGIKLKLHDVAQNTHNFKFKKLLKQRLEAIEKMNKRVVNVKHTGITTSNPIIP